MTKPIYLFGGRRIGVSLLGVAMAASTILLGLLADILIRKKVGF